MARSAKVVVMVDGLDIHYIERLGKRRCWCGEDGDCVGVVGGGGERQEDSEGGEDGESGEVGVGGVNGVKIG